MKIRVEELEHDDIVTILSDGLYGNYELGADYDSKEWEALDESQKTVDPCFEDKCADLLLAGKSITIADFEYDGELYGDRGVAKPNEDEYGDRLWDGCGGDEVAEYKVTLKDFLNACSCKDGQYWANQLANQEDDFYTGYNLIQLAAFGEIIYG